MRLVVCVDRDDDLGRKAQLDGPIVGRADVVDAAVRLGTADPEDSDTNALFAAVSLTDELKGSGEDCEVCVLTGSAKVGIASDRRVAEQFDQVLERVHASSAYLVSDGAEDEFLFPILASRVRIDGVRRVYVRQSPSLESTYYTLVRALKDPKLRAKTVLPVALALLVLGIAAAAGVIIYGVIGLAILLGVYLVLWTFDIDEAIIDSLRSASTDIRQGSVAFGFGLFSVALVGVGFLVGYNQAVAHLSASPLEIVLLFLNYALLWWIVAALIWESGRAIRRMFAVGRIPRTFPIAATSIIGLGFLGYGLIYLVEYIELAQPLQLVVVIGGLTAGFILVLSASLLFQHFKRTTREATGDATTS